MILYEPLPQRLSLLDLGSHPRASHFQTDAFAFQYTLITMEQPEPILESTLESHRGAAFRRGRQLAPIQTSWESQPSTSLQRPHPVETILYEQPHDHTSDPKSPHLQRRVPKGGLRTLFSRSKSTRDTKVNTRLQSTIEEEEILKSHPIHVAAPSVSSTRNGRTSLARESSSAYVPSGTSIPRSQPQVVENEARSQPVWKEPPLQSLKTFNPPPLFQAYPQSVKHSNLPAPTVSLDTILKMERNRQASEKKPLNDLNELEEDVRLVEDMKKHRSRRSNVFQIEWTSKVYVLATSGFLLQYAGDGSFDRPPEKLLQLGKDSAAFASDVIPGKCWVLQILQSSNEDGAMTNSKSVFSNFGFRSKTRRLVPSLLLVLDSPEEMSSWLVAVRKEIEALGGKRYRPNVSARKTNEEVVQHLRDKPSRRYLIKRDPNQFSNTQTVQSVPGVTDYQIPQVLASFAISEPDSLNTSLQMSIQSRQPLDTSAETGTAVQTIFDMPRDSTRSSYASSDNRDWVIPHAPLSNSSPQKSDLTSNAIYFDNHGALTTTAIDDMRRMSFQTNVPRAREKRPFLDVKPTTVSSRPLSTNSTSTLHTASPVSPSFSPPNFSKRNPQAVYPSQLPTPPASEGGSRRSSSPSTHDIPRERPDSVVGELHKLRVSPNASRSRSSLNTERTNSCTDASPFPFTSSPSGTAQSHTITIPFDCDRPLPRRFSSLEYSGGKPSISHPHHYPSPHPPPTFALPALPLAETSTLSTESRPISSHSASLHKLRRPASMQVRSDPLPQLRSTSSQARMHSAASDTPKSTSKVSRTSLTDVSSIGSPPKNPLPSVPVVKISESSPQIRARGWAEYGGIKVGSSGVRVS